MNPNPLAILRDIEQPPGGWRYTVPETGLKITGATPRTLRKRVGDHLRANGLPVPDDDTLDSLVCTQCGFGEPFCGPPFPEPQKGIHPGLSVDLANRFMKTMLKVAQDRDFVSAEEAQRRMDICNACPLACGIAACWWCNGLFTTIANLIAKDAPKSETNKEWCGACGCRTSLKCLIANETLDKAETVRPAYHESCWRLTDPPASSV